MKGNQSVSLSRQITYFAILAALTVVLQLFASAIPIGDGASLNLTLIPIVVTAMLLGVWYATAIGFISGIITMIQVVSGAGGIFSVLFTYYPVVMILICVLKITVAAFIGAIVFKAIKRKFVATFVSAGIVPVVNTLIFILGMLIVSNRLPEAAIEVGIEMENSAFLFIILILVGVNFFIEFGVNLIVAPALYKAVRVIDKGFDSETEIQNDNEIKTETNDDTIDNNPEGENDVIDD